VDLNSIGMKEMKCRFVVFVSLVMMMVGFGCSSNELAQFREKEEHSSEFDTKVISNLILYQYGRELSSWKAMSPKVSH